MIGRRDRDGTAGAEVRVLHIIGNLEIGGAQEVVRTLSKHLISEASLPVVCAFNDGPLRKDIEDTGTKVEILAARRFSILFLPGFIFDMIRIWRSWTHLVAKYDIHIIQTHLLTSLDLLVPLLRYTTSARGVLWTFHSTAFELDKDQVRKYRWLWKPRRLAHRILYRLTCNFVSGVIVVSEDVKTAVLKVLGRCQDKIAVICNGVDMERYRTPVNRAEVMRELGLDSRIRLISVVATLKKKKGHSCFLEAFKMIAERNRDIHCLIIGDGELKAVLQAQAGRLNLEGLVHFLGNRKDVPVLLKASDLFVLPSLREGMSVALLEAMAAGLPIVATDVSGTRQVMIPDKTGLLVDPGDIHQLSSAMKALLADPALAKAMGAAAQRRVQNEYGAKKQAEEHLALYHRVLTG